MTDTIKIGCFLSFILVGKVLFSQPLSVAKQEENLVQLYSDITQLTKAESDTVFYDKKNFYSDATAYHKNRFSQEFITFIKENPSTLHYDFNRLKNQEGFQITTSEEGELRVYSWYLKVEEKPYFVQQQFQYQLGDTVYTLVPDPQMGEGDFNGFCTAIKTLIIKEEKFYRMLVHSVTGGFERRETLFVFNMNRKEQLRKQNFFKVKNQLSRKIYVDYQLNNTGFIERNHIEIDSKNKRIVLYDLQNPLFK